MNPTAARQRIAVVGGSGFIGSRLVSALLAAGHEVRIYDKAASPLFPDLVTRGDVRDAAALAAFVAGSGIVINLAAEHADDVRPVSLYSDVNVGGAHNLVAACAQHTITRLLYVSSVSVYGLHQPMATEQSPLRPDSPYGRSKAQAEAVYRQWADQDAGRGLLLLRPVVVFGEGNRGNVFTLIDHLRRHRFRMVGRGRNRKSMAYVGNLVDFMVTRLAIDAGVAVCNYADKPDLSTGELVALLRTLMPEAGPDGVHVPYPLALAAGFAFDALALLSGRHFSISSARVRKFCADTRIDTPALHRSGFRPRYSLEDGLMRMVAHLHDV